MAAPLSFPDLWTFDTVTFCEFLYFDQSQKKTFYTGLKFFGSLRAHAIMFWGKDEWL